MIKKVFTSKVFWIPLLFFGGTISSIYGFTRLINFIILKESEFEIATNAPWINYYGTVFNGLITGLITILGVWLTISYYMNKDKKEERLKHLPYLRMVSENVLDKDFSLMAKFKSNMENELERTSFYTALTNMGLGPAVNIRITELTYNEISSQDDVVNLMPNESSTLLIEFGAGKNNYAFDIKIEFNDIHNNRYEQMFVYEYNTNKVLYISKPELVFENKI